MTTITQQTSSVPTTAKSPDPLRFLSQADCQAIATRLARAAKGGGITTATLFSTWTANVRWARNVISTSGEIRNDYVKLNRNLDGAGVYWMLFNDTSEAALIAGDRRAERLARLMPQYYQSDLQSRWPQEPAATPTLFFEATYQVDEAQRTAAVQHLAQTAAEAGMLSSGYVEVGAHSMALIDTIGHVQYCQYTTARVSTTVRDPKGMGSGWAGVDWPDWSRIDAPRLMTTALEKCLTSRNPVAIEPGRYTTILEPQAVGDFVAGMIDGWTLGWVDPTASQEAPTQGPFGSTPPTWQAKLGERVIDERLTIQADPSDPDLSFPPFNLVIEETFNFLTVLDYETYHPVTWIERGVLRALGYNRSFGQRHLHRDAGLPIQGAFRMSGGDTSIEEMIATTKRGLLVTRFDQVGGGIQTSGFTRDGLWLIENGKLSKPVKNMLFEDSILRALNSVEQLGVPQRIFRPWKPYSLQAQPSPVIVPPLKIRDFRFSALIDAI